MEIILQLIWVNTRGYGCWTIWWYGKVTDQGPWILKLVEIGKRSDKEFGEGLTHTAARGDKNK